MGLNVLNFVRKSYTNMSPITTVFFDLGGVCLSNGWDHEQRGAVAQQFGFDYEAFDQRHRQVVDTLERGQLSLEEYLQWTVFYQPRPFSIASLTDAIMQLSTPMPDTLKLVRELRQSGRYFIATLNNESRELNDYRIDHFDLRSCFSAFFTSCYFGLTKPQPEFYRRVLQITHCAPDECVFVDDRPMNAEVARILGMRAILFTDAAQLQRDLNDAGVTW